MTRTRIAAIVLISAIALLAAGLAGAGTSGKSSASSSKVNLAVSGSVTFDGIWTAGEAKAFGQVIAAFNKLYPNVHVNYKPVGNNVPTVLATAIAGGHPPDMADIAQPGLIKQLAQQGHLKPITYAKSTMASNFAPSWLQLGTFSGKLFALPFKVSNKSLYWYNVPAFKTAGVKPPKTWAQLTAAAKTLKASGTPAYSLCGASGWTLTDMFENIYLRTFGLAKYNLLTAHKIKWTDASVTKALKTMAEVVGDTSNLAGGTSGALQTDFPTCVTDAFSSPSKGAIVFEADFVAGAITSATKSKPGTGFNTAPFPAITPGPDSTAVEIGGDLLVAFRDTPAIEAFVKFLATAPAAAAWAKVGGFATGNHNLSTAVYPDAIDKANQAAVASAKAVVFDMSDEQPASFGGTTGQGEWGLFQNFLQNPTDVSGIQKKLEAAAATAYKKGK
jgi:ABC-type glycerol-3-phosphate transport system substrate-binding protein